MEDSYWGQFQFVFLMKSDEGKIVIKFHNVDDVWEELGTAELWYTTEDWGKTWFKPVRFDNVGVLPDTCRLGDTTLAIYGRPGIYVRGTTDPSGMNWDEPVEVMTNKDRSSLMNEPPARPNFHH